jgi:hypothetical protein
MTGRFALIANIARPNRADFRLSEIKAWLAILAEVVEKTARAMHAPFETGAAAAAEQQVAAVQARVAARIQSGGLREINRQYRSYRLAQVARAEKAQPYQLFVEQHFTVGLVRATAATGRMI